MPSYIFIVDVENDLRDFDILVDRLRRDFTDHSFLPSVQSTRRNSILCHLRDLIRDFENEYSQAPPGAGPQRPHHGAVLREPADRAGQHRVQRAVAPVRRAAVTYSSGH